MGNSHEKEGRGSVKSVWIGICASFFFSFKFFILFLNFTNCISFAKYQNESATGICASYEVLPGRESFRE